MATINYQLEQVSQNSTVVTWSNLANGDVGQSFSATGYMLGYWEITGTPGSSMAGKLMQAYSVSNPMYLSLTNFTYSNVPGLFDGPSNGNYCGSLYPEITAGDGTTDITITAVFIPQVFNP
jgi:hypothetical protein